MASERAIQFKARATECEHKASSAKTDEMRRAWLIAARDWSLMAEREEAKSTQSADA